MDESSRMTVTVLIGEGYQGRVVFPPDESFGQDRQKLVWKKIETLLKENYDEEHGTESDC